jgi:hypothetical protein
MSETMLDDRSKAIHKASAPDYASMLSSKESVANEILAWAKRRIMNNPISEKELENLLAAVKAAGRAEGYAQAKYEMARDCTLGQSEKA